ncbi:MAG: hypothetical protein HC805_01695 [Alkalinema sp. RL_2_19]|nr:hypothetical protein [Alkalinema sp. RL_2_19]
MQSTIAPGLDLERFLKEVIAPQAITLDHDPSALCQAFRWLGDQQLLGVMAPRSWGGEAWEH